MKYFFMGILALPLISVAETRALDHEFCDHIPIENESYIDNSIESLSLVDRDPGEVPAEALNFNISYLLTDFDSEQEYKIFKATELIKKIIKTKEFKNAVINYRYAGKFQFNYNNSLSNEKIYDVLIGGSELLSPGVDHKMDLDLGLYYTRKDVVAYTRSDTTRIFLNTKYYKNSDVIDVAGTLFHEWTHKLGFTHSQMRSNARNFTVPYALGSIIKKMIKNELDGLKYSVNKLHFNEKE